MDDRLADMGRFADPSVLIMSSLASGPKHGYAVSKDIEAFAGVLLQPATLYGAVGRLEARGLIEALPPEDRRRPYRLTGRGANALAAHLNSLQSVATTGLRRLAAQ
jgi:DNA-binding PadR family transcriptional regulator